MIFFQGYAIDDKLVLLLDVTFKKHFFHFEERLPG